ncbi:AI-2E family transporter [bacterium]|nr:AI-2E family transporter [bacterium]
MPDINHKTTKSDFYKYLLTIIGIALFAVIAYALRKVLAAVTISIVLFYILDPLATFLERLRLGKLSMSRTWAVMIASVIGIVMASLLLWIFFPPMIDQIKNLPGYKRQIDEVVMYIIQKIRGTQLPPEILDAIINIIEKSVSGSLSIFRHLAKGTAFALMFSQIILVFLIPFLTFYMLIEKGTIKAGITHIFPIRYQEEIEQILSESSLALRGYITGQVVLSLFMWVLITITLWGMGIKAPLFFGLVAGITKFIPIVGIFLGCIPAALAALSTSRAIALWVIVIFTIVQLFENKVILPLMLSHYVNLSPLTILCTLIIGEQLGGILGMFISTPIVSVLRVVYIHLRKKYV